MFTIVDIDVGLLEKVWLSYCIMVIMKKLLLFGNKIEVGISEISDGNMRFFGDGDENEIIQNQEKLGRIVGLSGKRIARIRTIYEGRESFTDYQEVDEMGLIRYTIENLEGQIPVTDGLITRNSDLGLLLPLADCLGAIVFDERQGILGLLHAGRQNMEQDGVRKFIEILVHNFGSKVSDLKVYYSPYARDYQITKLKNKTMAEVAKKQFMEAGVLIKNIIDSGIDVVIDKNYPSYSHGDAKTRFAVVAKKVRN